jgi:hypothetical protein
VYSYETTGVLFIVIAWSWTNEESFLDLDGFQGQFWWCRLLTAGIGPFIFDVVHSCESRSWNRHRGETSLVRGGMFAIRIVLANDMDRRLSKTLHPAHTHCASISEKDKASRSSTPTAISKTESSLFPHHRENRPWRENHVPVETLIISRANYTMTLLVNWRVKGSGAKKGPHFEIGTQWAPEPVDISWMKVLSLILNEPFTSNHLHSKINDNQGHNWAFRHGLHFDAREVIRFDTGGGI